MQLGIPVYQPLEMDMFDGWNDDARVFRKS